MNFKLIFSLLLSGLIVLFVTQNVEIVEIHFMVWQVSMSRSLLIFFVLAIGIIIGWLLHSLLMRRSRIERDQRLQKDDPEGEGE